MHTVMAKSSVPIARDNITKRPHWATKVKVRIAQKFDSLGKENYQSEK